MPRSKQEPPNTHRSLDAKRDANDIQVCLNTLHDLRSLRAKTIDGRHIIPEDELRNIFKSLLLIQSTLRRYAELLDEQGKG